MNDKSSVSKELNAQHKKAKPCEVGDAEKLMVCANCKIVEHTYCMQDMLFSAPVGHWLCHKCCSKVTLKAPNMENMHIISPNKGSNSVAFQQHKDLVAQGPIRDAFQSHVRKCASRYLPGNGKVKFIPSEELCFLNSGSRTKQQNTGHHTARSCWELDKRVLPRCKATALAIPPASLNRLHKSYACSAPYISSNSLSGDSSQKSVKPHPQRQDCGEMPSFLLPCKPPDVVKRIKTSMPDKLLKDSPTLTSPPCLEKTLTRLYKVKNCLIQTSQDNDISGRSSKVPNTEALIADANANNVNASMDEAFGGSSYVEAQQARSVTDNSPIPPKLAASPEKIYTNDPASNAIWKGSFEILDSVRDHHMYDGICAYPPIKVSKKAIMTSRNLPGHLKFTLVSRQDVWPKDFHTHLPSFHDIALYFFPCDRSRKKYDALLEHMKNLDLALVLTVSGAELLIFTSKQLHVFPRSRSTEPDMHTYLWGVYLPMKKSIKQCEHTQSDFSALGQLDELELPPGFPEKRVSKDEINKLELQSKSSIAELVVKTDDKVSSGGSQESSLVADAGIKSNHGGEQVTRVVGLKSAEKEADKYLKALLRDSSGEIDLNTASTPVLDYDLESQWIEIIDDDDVLCESQSVVRAVCQENALSKGHGESQMELHSETSYTVGKTSDKSIIAPENFVRTEETSSFRKTASPVSARSWACLELFPSEIPSEPRVEPDASDCNLELGVGLQTKNRFSDDWGDPIPGLSALQFTKQGPYWVNLKNLKKDDGGEDAMLKL